MILGLDHIALSANDLARAGQDLVSIGFVSIFACETLPNPMQKERFLRRLEPSHDIGQYRGKTGAAFEITVHGPVADVTQTGFQPVCGLDPTHPSLDPASDRQEITSCVRAAFSPSAEYAKIGTSLREAWIVRSGTEGLLGAVRAVGDLDSMRSFLTNGLGLRDGARGEVDGRRWSAFELAGPVKQWHGTLLFVEDVAATKRHDYLDDPGCPCVALLSSDLTKDLERLAPFVVNAERFQLKVGPTELDIALVRGPSGEIWELIDPRKKNRT